MKAIAILPARMGATRFPGKPLHPICGIPMVGHCYYRTLLAKGITATYVATCDEEIAAYVRSIGGTPVMTASTHNRASDRTAEAMLKIEESTGEKVDVVIMIQGDEPLILPETISESLHHFDDPSVEIVNIMSRLRTRQAFEDKNNVKVVVSQNRDALYFSREPIPSPWKGVDHVPMYMQVGVIAFRRDVLIRFNCMTEMPLEKIESVDMNRVLETGGKIRMVLTEALTIGVDTVEEADEVERILAEDPLFKRYANQ
ncbi:MAG: 3-deoxy-manno-octulosonate cytidylyltransferase [Magnetococcales bacterium]|nr:3-deoxy-manno-octulosonate cytidylyltransferase [Magnetococcales bacterium]